MNSAEMVTHFATREHRPHPDKPGYLQFVQMAKVSDLIKALNKHCGSLAEEYNFSASGYYYPSRELGDKRLPDYRWIIAFCVEGGSEGYYVHISAIMPDKKGDGKNECIGIALAKTYSAESAHKLTIEASRFLAAAEWN